MTNAQHEALAEAVARRSELAALLQREGKHSGVWFSEHLLKAADEIAALSATAATPSDEEVRLRAALEEIADGTLIALECGDTWPSPLGAKASQQIARAALEPQGKDL